MISPQITNKSLNADDGHRQTYGCGGYTNDAKAEIDRILFRRRLRWARNCRLLSGIEPRASIKQPNALLSELFPWCKCWVASNPIESKYQLLLDRHSHH
jgi:hypothetical protein